ncbi:hypothetical protein KQ313_03310 [Synechococcus sp. CS-1325]|uniref:hypothetical protein n=1 Tax=unclassified Synechococcus TaxID=2626047 RepID=UPI0021A5F8CF|nr:MULTISPECIES: hypothetical protein [unclassified Synechococcus]MCT0198714.1 hypothetical protein [Synechococcus sp. CS-1325]MCT0212945.1 hypothetical protein [Synechococcus sp. CS-1326]MCT0231525.1 hypothetical protein [Synechococcus sp. CS-1324]MCT0233149.1 hypothetical protein [Synechococcus sp. CS-1327]
MNRLSEPAFKPLPARKVFRKRRSRSPWREALFSLLNIAVGSGVLVALLQLPARIDSLLVVSKVISTLIKAISRIGEGILLLAAGLAQTFAILLVVSLAIAALLLLANGVFRILRLGMPGLGSVLGVPLELARMLWAFVQIRRPDRHEP